MKGLVNFLSFLNDNWTTILVIIGLIIGIYKKTVQFLSQKKEYQYDAIKVIIREIILDSVAKAEKDYEDKSGAGAIKRSQVIKQLYNDYPILSKISNQEEVINLIDDEINNALKNVRDVFREN